MQELNFDSPDYRLLSSESDDESASQQALNMLKD